MPNKSQRPKKRAFLAAYAETGNITVAADAAEINRAAHYKWVREDDDGTYAAAFEDAKQAASERLEQEARRRAVEGVEEPVGWHKGEPGGYVRRYSDTLLIFLLKGALPEKYAERTKLDARVRHSIPLEEVLSDADVDA